MFNFGDYSHTHLNEPWFELTQYIVGFADALPVLLYKFSEQTMQPGPCVSLKCIAKGNPPPRILWTLDGFPVPQNERFEISLLWHFLKHYVFSVTSTKQKSFDQLIDGISLHMHYI